MNSELTAKCQSYADNYLAVYKVGKLEDSTALAMAALMYTAQGKKPDGNTITKTRKLYKKQVINFNEYRGHLNNTLLTSACMADDPEARLMNMVSALKFIKSKKVFKNRAMVNASMTLCDVVQPDEYEATITKAKIVWTNMRENHEALADPNDLSVAVMMVANAMDVEPVISDAEACFEMLLGDDFGVEKGALQYAAYILGFHEGAVREKCERFAELRSAFKKAGIKADGTSLSIIAALTGCKVPTEQVVADVCEIDEFLKHQKGFGFMGVKPVMRSIFAAALAQQAYAENGLAQVKTSLATPEALQKIVTNMITIILGVEVLISLKR